MQASAAKFGEALKKCVIYLGREVIDPLEEFEVGIKLATEGLRDRHLAQLAALRGAPEGPVQASSPSSSAAALTLRPTPGSGGLVQQVQAARTRHLQLKSKLDALGCRIQQQKEIAASSLLFSKRKRVGLTRAEEQYEVQLQRWLAASQVLDVALARVQQQVEDLRAAQPAAGATDSSAAQHARSWAHASSRGFLTPSKPRASPAHISSPHRITSRVTPRHSPVAASSRSLGKPAASVPPSRRRAIQLQGEDVNSCAQLQLETGHLHEALKLKLKDVEQRVAKLAASI